MTTNRICLGTAALVAAVTVVTGCASMGGSEQAKPAWLTVVSQTRLDGRSDDLLTAGMGPGPADRQGRCTGLCRPAQAHGA